MLAVIIHLWQLLWFKSTPEACPYNRQAAQIIAMFSVFWVSARLQTMVPLGQALLAAMIPLLVMIGVLYLFLSSAKKTGRLVQLYTMIQGTSLILSLIGSTLVLLFHMPSEGIDLVLGFWHFVVMVIIFESAFETSKIKAFGLSVAFQLLVLILVAPLSVSLLSAPSA